MIKNTHQRQFEERDSNKEAYENDTKYDSSGNVILNDDMIDNLKNIQETYDKLIIQLGSLNINKLLLRQEEQRLEDEFNTIHDNEHTLLNELNTLYGEGSIDLENKIFIKKNDTN